MAAVLPGTDRDEQRRQGPCGPQRRQSLLPGSLQRKVASCRPPGRCPHRFLCSHVPALSPRSAVSQSCVGAGVPARWVRAGLPLRGVLRLGAPLARRGDSLPAWAQEKVTPVRQRGTKPELCRGHFGGDSDGRHPFRQRHVCLLHGRGLKSPRTYKVKPQGEIPFAFLPVEMWVGSPRSPEEGAHAAWRLLPSASPQPSPVETPSSSPWRHRAS